MTTLLPSDGTDAQDSGENIWRGLKKPERVDSDSADNNRGKLRVGDLVGPIARLSELDVYQRGLGCQAVEAAGQNSAHGRSCIDSTAAAVRSHRYITTHAALAAATSSALNTLH